MYLYISLEPSLSFCIAIFNAIRRRIIIWAVNVFVAATPISGPDWVSMYPSAILDAVLPMTFVMTSVLHPEFFASFKAARVSAVSPD